jgi:hypothetical protein
VIQDDTDGPEAPLWRAGDTAFTVALRIRSQLSLGKVRAVRSELGKLIRQVEDGRREAAERGRR